MTKDVILLDSNCKICNMCMGRYSSGFRTYIRFSEISSLIVIKFYNP